VTGLPIGEGPVRIPKMAEVVAHSIRRSVVHGDLREGDSLPPEAQLLARFNVSRPILREALRILESESLITLPRGTRAGATVHRPSRRVAARHTGLLFQIDGVTLAEVWDATTALIAPAARAVAAAGRRRDVQLLNGIVDELAGLEEDAASFVERAPGFNRALLELARNRAALILVGMIDDIVNLHIGVAVRDWRAHPTKAPDASRAVAGMRDLVGLIREKRADEAEAFWREKLDEGARYFLEHYGSKAVVEILN